MTPFPTLLSIILAGENLTRKDPQRQIKTATTVYKSLNGLAPDYLCSVTYRSGVTNYSLRDTNGKLAVSLIHSFVRSFIHSFIHSFVRSFVRSFVHSFIRSFTHSFMYLTPKKIRKNWFFTIYKKTPEILVGNFRSVRTVRVVYHLPKISGLSRRARLDSSYNMKLVRNSRNL